ncbi:MAG: tyrosine-type recombinase/integrase [bacterium]|nr:tyrosine-type recombinase/integrase [bacterium]
MWNFRRTRWIKKTYKNRLDFLFTRTEGQTSRPITSNYHQRLVKKWASMIRLNPDEYSTHSLRRTLPTIIYAETKNIEAVRVLLGQNSVTVTSHYLNLDGKKALDIAKRFRF